MKKGRLLRAGNYYERGSQWCDVVEAEDLGMQGKKDEKAVATNKRIRECQKPLLLNWGLVLIRMRNFEIAERKFTEVLMDIDKHCVKALFRRAQCFIELERCEEAKKDLWHARDLDDAIGVDVEKELLKAARKQKAIDMKNKDFMKKAFAHGLSDSRSESKAEAKTGALVDNENEGIDCRVKENSATRMNPIKSHGRHVTDEKVDSLMGRLEMQKQMADEEGMDDITYARQREELYNSFLRANPQQMQMREED